MGSGRLSPENSPSVADVGKRNTAGKTASRKLGAKAIVSREEESDNSGNAQARAETGASLNQAASDAEGGDATSVSRAERRQAMERERRRVTTAAAVAAAALMPQGSPAASATASRFPAVANNPNVRPFFID